MIVTFICSLKNEYFELLDLGSAALWAAVALPYIGMCVCVHLAASFPLFIDICWILLAMLAALWAACKDKCKIEGLLLRMFLI